MGKGRGKDRVSKWKSSKKSVEEKPKGEIGEEKTHRKSRKEKQSREELDGARSAVKVKTEKQL